MYLNILSLNVFFLNIACSIFDYSPLTSNSIYTVMLMGTLLYSVKYTLPEYFCTFLVAGGVSSFALLKVR
jgi:hypothetical protein